MTKNIEIEHSHIYLFGNGSQYMHDLKCSACFYFIANLEGKVCMFCDIFIFKLKHLQKQKKRITSNYFLSQINFLVDFQI